MKDYCSAGVYLNAEGGMVSKEIYPGRTVSKR